METLGFTSEKQRHKAWRLAGRFGGECKQGGVLDQHNETGIMRRATSAWRERHTVETTLRFVI